MAGAGNTLPRTPRPRHGQGMTLMTPASAWELLRETLTWFLFFKVHSLKQTKRMNMTIQI